MQLSEPEHSWLQILKSNHQQPWITAMQDRSRGKASYALAFGLADHFPNPIAEPEEVGRQYEEHLARPSSTACVQPMFTHDWANDPLSRGAWMVAIPNQRSFCLETVQKSFGNRRSVFASSDWAQRGYSSGDGAIAQSKELS